MFKIEKDIDMPQTQKRNRYPFKDMAVGDSFLVTLEEQVRLTSAASYAGKRNNRKFTIRKVLGGVRIWRIE